LHCSKKKAPHLTEKGAHLQEEGRSAGERKELSAGGKERKNISEKERMAEEAPPGSSDEECPAWGEGGGWQLVVVILLRGPLRGGRR